MQNQTTNINQPKGFFGKGLDALSKMKDRITGETQKQATKEIADLQRYIAFGTEIGIVDDQELAIHQAKIASLEFQIENNKIDGVKMLKSLTTKGSDMFTRAKSIDWNGLLNRAKGASFALGISAMSFLGNPAMASKTPASPVQSDNPVKVENKVILNSIQDAKDMKGSNIKPGSIVEISGRKIRLVGDGTGKVNLPASYRYAEKKLKLNKIQTVKNTTAPSQQVNPDIPSISNPTNVDTAIFSTPIKTVEKPASVIPPYKPLGTFGGTVTRTDAPIPQVPTVVPQVISKPVIKINPVETLPIKTSTPPKVDYPNKVTPEMVNPNPNIPYVKPPAPPRPDFDNYKPTVNENNSPSTDPKAVTPNPEIKPVSQTPVSDSVKDLQGLKAKSKLKDEVLPNQMPVETLANTTAFSLPRYKQMEKYDLDKKVQLGFSDVKSAYQDPMGFYGFAGIELTDGGAPNGPTPIVPKKTQTQTTPQTPSADKPKTEPIKPATVVENDKRNGGFDR
jgi:hypothetical protein